MKNKEIHMCDDCKSNIATCKGPDKLGGEHKDDVIECRFYRKKKEDNRTKFPGIGFGYPNNK